MNRLVFPGSPSFWYMTVRITFSHDPCIPASKLSSQGSDNLLIWCDQARAELAQGKFVILQVAGSSLPRWFVWWHPHQRVGKIYRWSYRTQDPPSVSRQGEDWFLCNARWVDRRASLRFGALSKLLCTCRFYSWQTLSYSACSSCLRFWKSDNCPGLRHPGSSRTFW